jgi:predicted nucleic acid-binding protein
MKVVIDTNILVDYLHGLPQAQGELARYARPGISLVTWMEVMIGAKDKNEETILRGFLSGFETLPITEAVAEGAVVLRKSHRIRLPDALIWATAQTSHRLLVTRNIRDFPASDPGIRIPYQI